MIHRPWLRGTAFVGLICGLTLALVPLPTDPTIDVAELLPVGSTVDFGRVLFAIAVITWAGVTFTESYRGRFAPVVSVGPAFVLGLWAVSLAGPLWFELATVVAFVFITLVCVPVVLMLAARPEAQ
jgi:hypothetical protein